MADISIREAVGGGYDEFWATRKFYRICKGSKGSKKSYTTALFYIYHMMKYPESNLLVIRKVFGTMHDTVYNTLLWAINRLQVSQLWKPSVAPLKLTYIPTGQVILFKGMDDALKIASITVPHGFLCWVWFEEMYDIKNEAEFDKVCMSIRGAYPPETGLWKQVTGTFNPWSENTWIKPRFFDNPSDDVFSCTTTYRCNEHLDPAADIPRYEDMYKRNPRAARVFCDGEWGISEGLIFENWDVVEFDIKNILKKESVKTSFGLDFGYAASYNAFVAIAVDLEERVMWVYDEMYERGLTNIDIAKKITGMGYSKEVIWADSAEPKSIYELQNGFLVDIGVPDHPLLHRYVLPNIRPAMKGPDSIRNGIANLQSFRINVLPSCKNMIMELTNYCYAQDKDGNFTEKPIDDFNHCLTAGTMVIARVNGEPCDVPIEDIRANDTVLTHKGWRTVVASGITRPVKCKIYRMTLEDGTTVCGTKDHPFPTTRGPVQMKDMAGQYVVRRTLIPTCAPADCPVGILDPWLNERRGMPSRTDFVDRVRRGDEQGYALVRVASVALTDSKQTVYDLTVEDAHDFYANGVLTLNCIDATRYAANKFFVRGKGYVAEAKGTQSEHHRGAVSRRVISSSMPGDGHVLSSGEGRVFGAGGS